MATANVTSDLEHFVNCGVCFCEFDEENRKPKFLQCAHTYCLKCLQEICRAGAGWITCPFCRKTFLIGDTDSLPNNSYALQMVKLREEREKPKVTAVSPLECRSCNSVKKAVMMEQTVQLASVLKKRKVVQGELDAIVKSITAVGDQVKKLQEENDIEMAELLSLIEVTPQPTASRSLPNPISPMIAKLVQSSMHTYIFILKVFNSGTSIGEIRIRPAFTFHPEFVQKLGQFCYNSPTNFVSTVAKAQAGVFVSISMSHASFRPTFAAANQTTRINALNMGEVGVIFKKKNQPVGVTSNTITDWNFFIPLNPATKQQKKIVSSAAAELFGNIIYTCSSPIKAVTEMSKSQKNERGRYTMSLESQ